MHVGPTTGSEHGMRRLSMSSWTFTFQQLVVIGVSLGYMPLIIPDTALFPPGSNVLVSDCQRIPSPAMTRHEFAWLRR